jgi:glycosyltransferase involved in cell wall biosynthesis
VIDFHSGCFLEAHWRKWDRMQRFFARHALLNLIHNDDNARAVASWGIKVLVFPSLPPVLEARATEPRDRPRVIYICSFKSDEPVDALLEAAKGVPEADFCVTGRAPEGLRDRLPANVKLTGFLSEEAYNELIGGADLVVALTTRPGTLLYGAQEAIALGKPLVLSRTPTLEAYFTGGSVFAENTPAALTDAIRAALARRAELVDSMRSFAAKYRAEGEARLAELRRVVAGSG